MAEKNLEKLLEDLEVVLNKGIYVFVSLDDATLIDNRFTLMEFREQEGRTCILEKQYADALNLDYDFEAAWITLNVHSALDAVGFSSKISRTLSDLNISANIVAAFYHDHIFVSNKDATIAVKALRNLSKK